MTYRIRITQSSGDVVSTQTIQAADDADAERQQSAHWNEHYGHTADRYMSELLKDDRVIMTVGGWDDDEDD